MLCGDLEEGDVGWGGREAYTLYAHVVDSLSAQQTLAQNCKATLLQF